MLAFLGLDPGLGAVGLLTGLGGTERGELVEGLVSLVGRAAGLVGGACDGLLGRDGI